MFDWIHNPYVALAGYTLDFLICIGILVFVGWQIVKWVREELQARRLRDHWQDRKRKWEADND